jgi:2,4'-dihydroxyacetophenone dioxygenase
LEKAHVLYSRGAGVVNRHYHPQQVFAYTISGKWGYLEHDWIATKGDWIFEAPGEAHALIAYASDEPMKVTFNVTGPLIWLDENGEPTTHSTCSTTSSCAATTTTRRGWARTT